MSRPRSRPCLIAAISLLMGACANGGPVNPDAAVVAIDAGLTARADAGSLVDASAPSRLLISEFVFSHAGVDTNEFIEVLGNPLMDFSDHTFLILEGDTTGAGRIEFAVALGTTDSSGYYKSDYFDNTMQNGSQSLLLVRGFNGVLGSDLDQNDDGVLDNQPWDQLIDGISVTDTDATDHIYVAPRVLPGFDGSSFVVGGASRVPPTDDTDTAADWVRNDFDGAGLPCCMSETAQSGEAINTPGAANLVQI